MPKFENTDPYSPKRRPVKIDMTPEEMNRIDVVNIKLRLLRVPNEAPQFSAEFVPGKTSSKSTKHVRAAFWAITVDRPHVDDRQPYISLSTVKAVEDWVEVELPKLYADQPYWWDYYSTA